MENQPSDRLSRAARKATAIWSLVGITLTVVGAFLMHVAFGIAVVAFWAFAFAFGFHIAAKQFEKEKGVKR